MAAPLPVNADIRMGEELLSILDRAQFPVTGATWIYSEDIEDWQLYLRTPEAERDRIAALTRIAAAMDAEGDLRPRLDLTRVKMVPPKDFVMAAIGRTVKADGKVPVRFNSNLVDGTIIGDALVYRLAA